jgi:hypothetical protein
VDVEITNGGEGTITGLAVQTTYAQGQTGGWLSAVLDGTIVPATLSLQASAVSLTEGTYEATVTVESPVLGGLSATLPVTFQVETPAPHIVVEPDAVGLSAILNGQQPVVQTVNITNGGGGELSDLAWSVSYLPGTPVGWLEIVLSSTVAPAELTLRAYPQGLPAGTYSANIVVSSPVADNSPQIISVAFTVALPELAALPSLPSLPEVPLGSVPGPTSGSSGSSPPDAGGVP